MLERWLTALLAFDDEDALDRLVVALVVQMQQSGRGW
jgi:hypothetical protein